MDFENYIPTDQQLMKPMEIIRNIRKGWDESNENIKLIFAFAKSLSGYDMIIISLYNKKEDIKEDLFSIISQPEFTYPVKLQFEFKRMPEDFRKQYKKQSFLEQSIPKFLIQQNFTNKWVAYNGEELLTKIEDFFKLADFKIFITNFTLKEKENKSKKFSKPECDI